jgi:hypothetical protein
MTRYVTRGTLLKAGPVWSTGGFFTVLKLYEQSGVFTMKAFEHTVGTVSWWVSSTSSHLGPAPRSTKEKAVVPSIEAVYFERIFGMVVVVPVGP